MQRPVPCSTSVHVLTVHVQSLREGGYMRPGIGLGKGLNGQPARGLRGERERRWSWRTGQAKGLPREPPLTGLTACPNGDGA